MKKMMIYILLYFKRGAGGGGASHTCRYRTNCGPKFHFGRTTGRAREQVILFVIYYKQNKTYRFFNRNII